jgi:hypothetical protein
MDLHPDLIDLLTEFESCSVEYLVIGGWAVSTYSTPRYTKDLDLWIGTSAENLLRVIEALERFGAPAGLLEQLRTMKADEFAFFGVPPARVDLLRTIPGVEFGFAWAHKSRVQWGPLELNLIGFDDLIAAKRAAGRPRDLDDVEQLLAARSRA